MSSDELDISSSLAWEEGLPHPQWDVLEAWVNAQGDENAQTAAWTIVARQWLSRLADALGEPYRTAESEHAFLLVHDPDRVRPLLGLAAETRNRIVDVLGDVAGFHAGKQVIVALRNNEDYYRYVSRFTPEGEQGGSAGMHIREGYSHIALCNKFAADSDVTLAHELTHAALEHRPMPQWIEEGLAQAIAFDMTRGGLTALDAERVRLHKRYWAKHGLDAFWRGDGFSRAGRVQGLSYQLAEIIVRLLIEESRPRWFGWVKAPQHRFFAFLREVNVSDCGEAACREYLKCGLGDLAARFLGPGEWAPSL